MEIEFLDAPGFRHRIRRPGLQRGQRRNRVVIVARRSLQPHAVGLGHRVCGAMAFMKDVSCDGRF
jgi:hypothetical protein